MCARGVVVRVVAHLTTDVGIACRSWFCPMCLSVVRYNMIEKGPDGSVSREGWLQGLAQYNEPAFEEWMKCVVTVCALPLSPSACAVLTPMVVCGP